MYSVISLSCDPIFVSQTESFRFGKVLGSAANNNPALAGQPGPIRMRCMNGLFARNPII